MTDTATIIIQGIQTAGIITVAVIAGRTARKTADIHHQLNSMRDQENATNRKLGQEEGKASEKEKNVARDQEKPLQHEQ